MYVSKFRKVSVGLFQKHFASISETVCHNLNIKKKQVRIKELENRDEAKRKASICFNFFKRIFLKEEKKTSGKTTKQERLGKTVQKWS